MLDADIARIVRVLERISDIIERIADRLDELSDDDAEEEDK